MKRVIWLKKVGPGFGQANGMDVPFLRRPDPPMDYQTLKVLTGRPHKLRLEPPLWRLTSVELAGLIAMVGTLCLCVGYLAGCLRMVGPW